VPARFLVGDAVKVLRTLPEASVDLVLTSPPFLALRSYLADDDPAKAQEIGSEPTPGDYIDALLDVVEACDWVLAPHGSLVIELGDTYSGSGGAGGDYNEGGLRDGQQRFNGTAAKARAHANKPRYRGGTPRWDRPSGARAEYGETHPALPKAGEGWPLDKSLCGIPQALELSLIWGRNILRPERLTEPWRVRNLVPWCRPNPPVGALSDKFRPATSYLTCATHARNRYFDLDAVRTPHTEPERTFWHQEDPNPSHGWAETGQTEGFEQNAAGAPPLDFWVVATQPYPGAHYATWPIALLQIPILTMCPQRVCTVCGAPSRRIIEPLSESPGTGYTKTRSDPRGRPTTATAEIRAGGNRTLGWTDCGHDSWRNGVVCDPFAGSGTTLAAATGHGRDAIGIDLDERNVALAAERVGMFLQLEV
jgi:hypothetical protein